jgi:hypothetical protein
MIYKRIISVAVLLSCYVNVAALDANQIFWSDSDASTLWRANEDGSGASILLTFQTGAEPRGVAVDATRGLLYWAENGTNRIRRANLDGSAPHDIITSGLGFPADIELDLAAGKLYWADRDLDVIRRANLDGSDAETVVSVPAPGNNGAPYFLELDTQQAKLYWSDFDSGIIHRANLDGSAPESFVSGLDRVRDIEILGGMIYWTDRDTRLVQKQQLDGSLRQTLYRPSGLVLPHGLALDPSAGFLYVADADGGQVYRGKLDGTGALEPIPAPGLQNPWDVEVSIGPDDGDYNGDGVVDAADYVVWRKGLGTVFTQDDYNIWRAHFGQTLDTGSSLNGAVPEPVSSIFIICTLCWLPRLRRG